jgi:hypothetical protein
MDDKLQELYETPISEMHNLPLQHRALYRLHALGEIQPAWLRYKLGELYRRKATEEQEAAARNIAIALLNLTGDVNWNTADEMYAGWEEDQLMARAENIDPHWE